MTFAARLVAYEPAGGRLPATLLDSVSWDASLPLNDVSALTLSYPDVVDPLGLASKPVEIAVEVSKGGAWVEPRNARFLSSELQADLAAELDVPRYTFRGLGALLERPFVLRKSDNKSKPYTNDDDDPKRNFLSASAGQIIASILDESREKYPTMLQGIELGFTASKDSLGNNWNKLDSVAYSPGTDLLRILDDMTARGICDWWMQGRTLMAANADSAAVKHDLRLTLLDVTESPLRATFENLASTVIVEGGAGKHWSRNVAGAKVPYGARVIRVANDAVTTDGTALDLIARQALQATSPRREYTRTIATVDLAPLLDFECGDWVWAKTSDVWEQVRVHELGLSFSQDDAVLSARVTLNDRFVDAAVRDAKRLQGITHGTTQNLGSGGVPSRADKAVPAAPKGVAANSLGYWQDAVPLSSVDVSWQAVTADVNGLALNGVDYYEVTCGGQTKRSSGTSVGFDGLQPSRVYEVRVRAISSTGIRGKWSAAREVLTAYPLPQLDPPTMPTFRTESGAFQAIWDGKLQGDGEPYLPPKHFSHVVVEVREEDTLTWTRYSRDSGFVQTGLTAGTKYYARFVAVDVLGNESEPGPEGSVTVESSYQAMQAEANRVAAEAEAARDQAAQALDEAFTAQGGVAGALTAVSTLDSRVSPQISAAQTTADQAASEASAAKQDALDAWNRAGEGISNAALAQSAADDAMLAAGTAQGSANLVASDLLALAGKTGRTIRSTTSPTGDDRNQNNLWLNTGSGQLYEWTGSKWSLITDSRLTAAAAKADQAQNLATNAQSQADLAIQLAEAAAGSEGSSLYPDPSFENGGVGLAASSRWEIVESPLARHGTHVLRTLEGSGSNVAYGGTTAYVVASGGESFSAEFWVMRTSAAQTGNVGVWVRTIDADGTVYNNSYGTPLADKPLNQWFKVSATFLVPAGRVGILMYPFGNVVVAGLLIDSVKVVEVTAAQNAIRAANLALTVAEAAETEALAARSEAASAQASADAAQTAASSAQSTADTAKTDAAAAAGIAGGKADVLIRSTTPGAAYRKTTTLWIDTTGGKNTPKRWVSGSTWAAVTDKTAVDAANAAAAAQTTANNAVSAAAAAQSTANQAVADAALAQSTADTASAKATTADGRYTVATANPVAADAVGKPIDAVWEVRAGGKIERKYVLTGASTWTQVRVGQDFIGENAIGSAQIGDAAVGTAQIADATVTNAKIGDLSVGKLTATQGAKFPVAVIDSLVTDDAYLSSVYSNRVIVDSQDFAPGPGGYEAAWRLENATIVANTVDPSGFALSLDGTLGVATARGPMLPVSPGTKILVEAKFSYYSEPPGSTTLTRFRWYDASGNSLDPASSMVAAPTSEGTATISGAVEVPADARFGQISFEQNAAAAGGRRAVRNLNVRPQLGAVLIEDGAVTAPKITASEELSAKVAQFLSVETGKITWDNAAGNNAFIGNLVSDQAFLGSIYTNRVVVDPQNYAPGPGGYEGVWELRGDGATIINNPVDPSGRALSLNGTEGVSAARGPMLPVTPGSRVSVEATFSYNGAPPEATTLTRFRWYDATGKPLSPAFTTAAAGTAAGMASISGAVEVPAGARFGQISFEQNSYTSGGPRVVRNLNVRPQVGATLIENGAITTEKIFADAVDADKIKTGALDAFQITSPLIQSVSTANRGIKWNGANLIGYDSSGSETFRLDATRATITGGIIQTVAQAARGVKLTGNGISAYDANGVETARITGDPTSNILVGRFYTNLPGKQGIIMANSADTGRPVIALSLSGSISGTDPRVYVSANGDLTLTGAAGRHVIVGHTSTTVAANTVLATNPEGAILRSTSLRKAKTLIEDAPFTAEEFLRLRPRTWYDKGQVEAAGLNPETVTEQEALDAGLRRIPGFVAEEVVEVLPILGAYDADGEVDGLQYDRFTAAMWATLVDQNRRIRALENQR